MLNLLIRVASGFTVIGVLVFILIGAVAGGEAAGYANRPTGYVVGAAAGFCVAAVVFGVIAAIFDMQQSLRVLADAAKRATRATPPPVPQ